MKRAPLRAWLVTGPVGRLVGFVIEFGLAMRSLAVDRRRRRSASNR
jgi:hypothetical protein